MSTARSQATDPGCAWTAGMLLGAIAAVGLLGFGVYGLAFAVIALGLILWKGPRQIAFGGFLSGMGGVWAYLFGAVLTRCAGENAEAPGSCDAGDVWPWVLGSVVALVVGVALSIVAARRAR